MRPEDRRQSARLLPKDQSYVALRPDFARLGKIVDISQGGICFQYLASRDDNIRKGTRLDVDIFIGNNGFYLPGVPCRLVHRIPVHRSAAATGPLINHRCGVRFEPLNEDQQRQVHLFLKNHAWAPETDAETGPSTTATLPAHYPEGKR